MNEPAQITARESLAVWLKSARAQKKLSLEDVAKITKIQPRILDKLERGELDGLPAEVFVKGFVRSFAKCVGLDEQEALVRYGACKSGDVISAPVAKALVESMGLSRKVQGTPSRPTPVVATPAVAEPDAMPAVAGPVAAIEVAPVQAAPVQAAPIELPVEAAPVVESLPTEQPKPKKKTGRKKSATSGAPRSRKKKAAAPVEVIAAPSSDLGNEVAPPANGIGLAATSEVDEDAHTSQLVKISLDEIANDVVEAKHEPIIDAKTDAAIIAASITETQRSEISDGSIELPRLAEGSQRISSSKIEVVEAAMLDAIESTDSTVDVARSDFAGSMTRGSEIDTNEPQISGSWQPTMPPIASTPAVPWRRPHITASRAYVVPSLVIDDADPDSADRERENRGDREQSRLSFLPPILLDREDRSARQGGLTLAVIILLIAATLTLSYLMRRPSSSGDGVTMNDTSTQLLS